MALQYQISIGAIGSFEGTHQIHMMKMAAAKVKKDESLKNILPNQMDPW
jgi:hypothetical protein